MQKINAWQFPTEQSGWLNGNIQDEHDQFENPRYQDEHYLLLNCISDFFITVYLIRNYTAVHKEETGMLHKN